MSTTVVYASGESGWVRSNVEAVYLNAARGAGGLASSDAGRVGQGTSFVCYQGFSVWDTSAIGTDTVSNVDFDVDGLTDTSTTDFVIEGYAFAFGTLTTADYRDSDTGIPALGSIVCSRSSSGWDTGAGYLNDMGANAAFASAINGAGDTEIVLISQEHRNESEPTANEYVIYDNTGATYDARLTITHAASGPTYTYAKPDGDITTTGWTPTPLWSKVDDDPASPDATVITATAD